MAVTSNTPIKQSDLAALAAAANGLVGTGRLGNPVSPMYPDGTGADWGYQIPSIKLNPAALGTNYRAGETVQGPTGEMFTIGSVGPHGELLGLVQTGGGTPQPYTLPGGLPTSPFNLTGAAHGSGAQVLFTWNHVGPTQSYAFPEWYLGKGIVTGFIITPAASYTNQTVTITSANRGYTAGDAPTVPEFSGVTINVTGVDANGNVTAYSVTDPGFIGTLLSLPSNVSAMPASGGTGTGMCVTALYIVPPRPAWASEMARMRLALFNYLEGYGNGTYNLIKVDGYGNLNYQPALNLSGAVSSPNVPQSNAWPVPGADWKQHNQNFWFRDTGDSTNESVTISSGFTSPQGKFTTAPCYCDVDAWELTSTDGPDYSSSAPAAILPRLSPTSLNWHDGGPSNWTWAQMYTADYPTGILTWCANNLPSGVPMYDPVQIISQDYEIVIGGQTDALLVGTFTVNVQFTPPSTDRIGPDPGFDPTGYIEVTGNFPGTVSITSDGQITWTVNQTVSPGNYKATVTCTLPTSDHQTTVPYDGDNPDVSGTWPGPTHRAARWVFHDMVSDDASISHTFMGAVADNGIDGSKQTYRISIPDGTQAPYYMPYGLYSVIWQNTDLPGTLGVNAALGYPYFSSIPGSAGQFGGSNDQFDPWTNLNSIPITDTNNRAPGVPNMATSYMPSDAWKWYPFPQPTFLEQPYLMTGGWSVSTSTPGYWTARTIPVRDLLPLRPEDMPWNFQRTKSYSTGGHYYGYGENPMLLGQLNPDNIFPSNTYAQGTPVEYQNEPARWTAHTWITVGFTICDANGKGIFKCTTAGYTGSAEPSWVATVGSTVTETPSRPSSSGTPPIVGRNQGAAWTCIKAWVKSSTWAASTAYAIGVKIIDGNGNTQEAISGWNALQTLPLGFTIIDSNNNQQTVTTAGKTGSAVPAWATVALATTSDGTVVWTLTSVNRGAFSNNPISGPPTWPTVLGATVLDFEVLWEMTIPIADTMPTAPHRFGSGAIVPRWPVYRDAETVAALKAPTTSNESDKTIWGCGNQWHNNPYNTDGGTQHDDGWQDLQVNLGGTGMAAGCFVYSIDINRISDATGTVAVTLGCMRSGSFYAFGTYATGQKIVVMWPIMTTDALVYQCSERVDVQAVVIGRGGAGVSIGLPDVNSPICAAFLTDTLALIGFVQ